MPYESLIIVIIGGIFSIGTALVAFFQYDKILQNKLKYHAKEVIFDCMNKEFSTILDNLSKLNILIIDVHLFTDEVDKLEKSKDPVFDGYLVIASNLSELEIGYGESPTVLKKWVQQCFIKDGTPNADEISEMSSFIFNLLDQKHNESLHEIEKSITKLLLYIKNEDLITHISALKTWHTNLFNNKKEYNRIYEEDNHAIDDHYYKTRNHILYLMRIELEETIDYTGLKLGDNYPLIQEH